MQTNSFAMHNAAMSMPGDIHHQATVKEKTWRWCRQRRYLAVLSRLGRSLTGWADGGLQTTAVVRASLPAGKGSAETDYVCWAGVFVSPCLIPCRAVAEKGSGGVRAVRAD